MLGCRNRVSLCSCRPRGRDDLIVSSDIRELCGRDSVGWQARAACIMGHRVRSHHCIASLCSDLSRDSGQEEYDVRHFGVIASDPCVAHRLFVHSDSVRYPTPNRTSSL